MTLARGTIVLIGMRGVGKTSVGRALARRLDLPFVDLDHRIEAATGRAVRTLFEAEGERAFRARELAALRDVPARPCVLATGGGVIETAAARAELARADARVWCQAEIRGLARRLERDTTRPRLRSGSWLAELRALGRRRNRWYQALATHVVRCADRSVEAIAETLERRLRPR
ncbi:MAG: shikimate kinase AroK [Planctomycetes bacterium]|nr:shikimate kinase AroK [Planctomycetota bacterium]MCC7171331.1 shikimate kinase AroK [Planctomycetota bacterium]